MLLKGIARFTRLALSAFVAVQLSACVLSGIDSGETVGGAPETTYRKFLARAEAGNAESQNLVGFMLFHGEGVRMDRSRARMWFERAAAQGNPRAQRNLAIMRTQDLPETGAAPDRRLTRAHLQESPPGKSLYEKFCAGCHGFNGVAAYVHSPSFALGETLEKSDAELMISVLRGKGEMPNWDNKFPIDELQDALRFVRTLPARYELGIDQTLSGAPPIYFLFGPMEPDQRAYHELLRDYGFDPPGADK